MRDAHKKNDGREPEFYELVNKQRDDAVQKPEEEPPQRDAPQRPAGWDEVVKSAEARREDELPKKEAPAAGEAPAKAEAEPAIKPARSAGEPPRSGKAKGKNQRTLPAAPAASEPASDDNETAQSRAAAWENEKTRMTSLPQAGIAASELAPQEEEEYELPVREPRDFSVNVESAIKKIPDYTLETSAAKSRRAALSVFAKVMLAIVVLGLSAGLSITILFCVQEVFGFNKPDQAVQIEIPRSAGLSQVAEKLEEMGMIRSADLFKVYYKLTKPEGEFQYGTYKLNTKMSYDEIFIGLFEYASHKEEVTVMFPEGTTIYEMSKILEQKEVCFADEFLETVDKGDFTSFDFVRDMKPDELRYHPLEGYLFPDTYKFFKRDKPENIVTKMLQNFDSKMVDGLYGTAEEKKISVEDIVSIASIVQLEAGKTSDMKLVASVYWNRINNPGDFPNLQADPTRAYKRELEEQMGSSPNEAILAAYYTYEGRGLPPGPICNPGVEAIEATLNPTPSDYFFFCNNLETREVFFAKTMAEHERNLVEAGLVD